MLLSMLPWSGRPPVGSRWYLAGHETSRGRGRGPDNVDQTERESTLPPANLHDGHLGPFLRLVVRSVL